MAGKKKGSVFCRQPSETKNRWLWLLAAFAVCLIPRLVFAFRIVPFEYATDEFSTLSAASLIYPGDWSEVLSACRKYYGGGFSILLFPLFYLVRDPLVIYRIMLIIMCLLQALITIPAFLTADRHFGVRDGGTLFLFSAAASYMVTRRSNNVTNEHILYLLTWLIVLAVLELADREIRNGKMTGQSILLGLLLAYGVAVHERGLVLICAFAVAYLLYLITFRRQIVSLLFFLPAYAAGYFCSRLLKRAILANNFSGADKIGNTTIGFSNIRMMLNPANIRPYLLSLAGSLTTSSLVTCGLVISAIVICFGLVFGCLFQAKQMRAETDALILLKKFSVCFIFLVSGLVAVLLWQPLSWVANLEAALAQGWGSNHYSLKILTYIRYYGNFTGPAVMLSILWYRFDREKNLWKYTVSMFILLGLGMVWVTVILRHIAFSTFAWEAWLPFGGKALFSAEKGYGFYRYGLLILAASAVLFFVFLRKRRFGLLLLTLCLFAFFEYVYLSIHFDISQSQKYAGHAADWAILNDTGIGREIEELYVNGNNAMVSTMQFLFYDKTVHARLPDLETEEGLVISTRFDDFEDALEYGWMMADQEELNACVFVKGEHIVRLLEEGGIRCVSERVFRKKLYEEDFISGEDLELYLRGLYRGTEAAAEDDFEEEMQTEDQGRAFAYKDVVDNETDAWKLFTPGGKTLSRGTYHLQIELKKALSDPPKVQLITKNAAAVPGSSLHSEDGLIWEMVFSILNTEHIRILISAENEKPAISLVRIDRMSDVFSVGMDSEKDMAAINEKICEDHQHKEIVFLCNRPGRIFSLDYLSELFPGMTVSSANEMSVREKDNAYVIARKNDVWLRITKWFRPVLVTENYVLLSSSEKSDGFVPISLLGNEEDAYRPLLYGDYSVLVKDDLEQYDEEVSFTVCSADGTTVYCEGPVEREGNDGIFSFRNEQQTVPWKIIFRHGGETVSVEEDNISISQTKTRTRIIYNRRIRSLLRILSRYPGTGTLTIYGDLNGMSSELVGRMAKGDLSKGWELVTAQERDLEISSLFTDGKHAYIIPGKSGNLFEAVPEFVIAGASSAYILLLPDTQQVKDGLRQAQIKCLSDGLSISGAMFDTEEDGQVFSLKEGTYRFYCDPTEDAACLYVPSTAVSEPEAVPETEAETEEEEDQTGPGLVMIDERKVLGGRFHYSSFAFTSGLRIRDVNDEAIRIVRVEKISDDYCSDPAGTTVTAGAYDAEGEVITGENEIRLETDPVPVQSDSHYLIEVDLEGEPGDVLLEFVNREFANEVVCAKTDVVKRREDGRYTCSLIYHSRRMNGNNLVRLAASFNGTGIIRQIRVKLMDNALYQFNSVGESPASEGGATRTPEAFLNMASEESRLLETEGL